ncbi:MAG TPA: gluconate 2-dehydrogenase subunit 3 family protein [Myxococcales bacterium]|jgi:gluconate 2-dehydrogenase gamma chain
MKCTRRQVLIGFFGLAAGGGIATRFALKKGPTQPKVWPPLPFPPPETRALLAAFDHLLPGATDAGVQDHVAWWLANDRYMALVAKDLQEGAAALDTYSQKANKKLFADASVPEKDAVFKLFQSGEARSATFDGKRFMERLVVFTMEGYLGDPKYGGNRGQVGWKFIGFKPCWWAPRVGPSTALGVNEGGHDHAAMGHGK